MNRQIKKNSFAEGAILSYIAIVLTKVLGALYSIPFYSLIGDKGGFIYSCAYNIYALFLEISTSGIPIALSIIIGEYTALGKERSVDRAYKLSLRIVTVISIFAFLVMQLFSGSIAKFFIGTMTYGATVHDVTVAIRIVSLCVLVVPYLAVERGYMQGHKFIAISSNSQLVEQLFRIFVVLAGAYITIMVMGLDVLAGVGIALTGAAFGGLAGLLYLLRRKRINIDKFTIDTDTPERAMDVDSNGVIAKKLLKYCVVVIIISIAMSIYNIVDMKLIIVGMLNIGYSDTDTQMLSSITSLWIPKIGNVIFALAIGMTGSIAPHIADDYTRGDIPAISDKMNQAIEIIFLIAMPLAVGIAIFSDAVYCFFYGQNEYGPWILIFSAFFNVISSTVSVFSMSMQSMGRGRFTCFAMVLGMVVNACLDLPFIYLLNRLDWHPYVGATVSSIVAQSLTLVLLAVYMSRHCRITYSRAFSLIKRILVPLLAMALICIVVRVVWQPVLMRGWYEVIQLVCYAGIGIVVYFGIASRMGIVNRIFGMGLRERLGRIKG